jgi:putative transposase
LIEELHEMPRNFICQKSGRSLSPSLGLIDSRSVKTSPNGGLERGIDGGKKTKGRKQHIITDAMGLVLTVVIHAANVHDI